MGAGSVLPDTDAAACHLAGVLRQRVATRDARRRPIHFTVSIGVASMAQGAGGQSDSAHDVLCRADAALYRAKATGRNRFAQAAPAEEASEETAGAG